MKLTAAMLVALLAANAQFKAGPAMIVHGGDIITLDPSHPVAEAMAIRDGKILALGTRDQVLAMRHPDTKVIDLRGKTLLPSLKDHHLHILNIGYAALNRQRNQELSLDLSAARSEQEAVQRVAERAAKMPKGSWVFGTGWNQRAWGTEKLPTHVALSKAVPEHHVMLIRVDAHSAWVNAAALTAAGITKDTQVYGGGILHLEDGSPSGILLERAVEPLIAKFPQPSDDVVREAFLGGLRTIAAHGITDVYDAGFLPFPSIVGMKGPFEHYWELLHELDAAEPLPVRVNLMVPAPSPFADAVTRNPRAFAGSPRLRVTHIKLFADGAMGSRGAATSRPYADDPSTRGVFRMSEQEIRSEVWRAIGAGYDVATHAIGDAAITRVLDVYEELLRVNASVSPRRLRIEHLSVASQTDIERAARLGVLIVAQPGFVWPDADGYIMEDSRVGRENTNGAYAWGTLSKLGAALAGSSDDYTLPVHPLWNFYAAATRKNPEGQPANGWHPAEKLSRDASLRLMTHLYPPGGGEVSSGPLRVGAAADLVVLSANPLTAEESKILRIKVHATLAAGRITYTDGSIP